MKQNPMKAYKPTLNWDPATYQDIYNMIKHHEGHCFIWETMNAQRNLRKLLKKRFEEQEEKLNEKD